MVALLREFPDVQRHLQPRAVAARAARGVRRGPRARPHLELGLKPADAPDRRRARLLRRELLPRAAAADDRPVPALRRAAARSARRRGTSGARGGAQFSDEDLRDLQVWHKLAWIDPFYLDARRAHPGAGRRRTAASPRTDKATLREVELEILRAVIPEYRGGRGARPGRALDLAVLSPDSAAAVRHGHLPAHASAVADAARSGSAIPRTRPSSCDAPSACHERLFGRAPAGLWPSEGSVSDAMVPLVADAGFTWMATDEAILARTLGIALRRATATATSSSPRRCTARTASGAAEREVACGFRDHALSDLIGFTYAGWAAEAAADDFVGRLVEGGPAVSRAGPAGKRRPSPSSSTARTPGSTSRAAAGHSCARSIGALVVAPRAPHGHDDRGVRAARTTPLTGIFPGSWINARLLHLDRPRRRPPGLEPAGRGAPGARRAAAGGRRGGARARPARSC